MDDDEYHALQGAHERQVALVRWLAGSLVPDPVLFLPGFPRCPTCSAEAHELTFSPAVDSEETRVLTDFAWRCPNGHAFATAMPDIPLPSWRALTERPYA